MIRTIRVTVRGSWARGFAAAALLTLALTVITPVAHAVTAMPDGTFISAVAQPAGKVVGQTRLLDIQTPALTPGLPPPQLSSLSDRRIVAGVILVLFAGLAGLTAAMWRELGRRVDIS